MAAEPIRQHPDNPHVFLWRGRATVLVTSAEHYGAVLNRAFDTRRYLKALEGFGFNQTRTFSGVYCEPQGAFHIRHNTLAPAEGDLICPWARSDRAGYANGGSKFDLARWDPAYFKRLKAFLAEAGRRGVVVEYVLFCPFYKDAMWALSPMNAANNVNGVGRIKRTSAMTLRNGGLLEVQLAFVRKVVTELNGFDNLYYEICNEPYFGGVTDAWQRRIAETIAETEKALPHRHLIARNIANGAKRVVKAPPHVSILNFHYATPPKAVAMNYRLGLVLGDDETGFKGSGDAPYRMEGWDFLLAGGGVFSNLDYAFTVGHEDGSGRNKAPGGGSAALHRQIGILAKFMASLDVAAMRPDAGVLAGDLPEGVTARALAAEGRQVAVYIRGDGCKELRLRLGEGTWLAEWVDTKTGRIGGPIRLEPRDGQAALAVPAYRSDVALRVTRRRRAAKGRRGKKGGNI